LLFSLLYRDSCIVSSTSSGRVSTSRAAGLDLLRTFKENGCSRTTG
jgi:hypothetical protein